MKEMYLVTKNAGKLAAAQYAFTPFDIILRSVETNYPEIQAESSIEIAKFTALQAAKDLNAPTIREDHSMFINALAIPGPYSSYIEKKIPTSKLLKILNQFSDRSGFFEIATVYAEPSGLTKEFVYQVPIHIAKKEKGSLQNGWAQIIILQDETRTIAEYPEKERLGVWSKNYEAIARYLWDSKKL